MKRYIFIAILTVSLLGWCAWQDHQRLATAKLEHGRTLSEAGALGVEVSGDGKGRPTSRPPRPTLPGREAKATAAALKLTIFGNDLEAPAATGPQCDQQKQTIYREGLAEASKLDAAGLEMLAGEILSNATLTAVTRRVVLFVVATTAATVNPAAVLALYSGPTDLAKVTEMQSGLIVGMALAKLADAQPAQAVEWIRQNSLAHADLIDDQTKATVLGVAAQTDPKLAFSLLDEFGLANSPQVIANVAKAAATPDPATAAQWALTLPVGDERSKLMTAIYTEWNKRDKAAAAKFAQENGIGE